MLVLAYTNSWGTIIFKASLNKVSMIVYYFPLNKNFTERAAERTRIEKREKYFEIVNTVTHIFNSYS